MLRARLLTSLVFNLVIALWVLHDGRARRARKPVFAAVLALAWGPLGLGFWESDRPLGAGEVRRGGTARHIARGFLRGWVALLPAMFTLALPFVADRAAVPGSLGRQIGIVPAAIVTTAMFWSGPALVALGLGAWSRREAGEAEPPMAPATSLPSSVAAGLAGAAALATAIAMTV